MARLVFWMFVVLVSTLPSWAASADFDVVLRVTCTGANALQEALDKASRADRALVVVDGECRGGFEVRAGLITLIASERGDARFYQPDIAGGDLFTISGDAQLNLDGVVAGGRGPTNTRPASLRTEGRLFATGTVFDNLGVGLSVSKDASAGAVCI